jgi:hypothetical protein
MRKLHIAISTRNIEGTIKDYSERLSVEPCSIIVGEYALWRTETFNISIRHDPECSSGSLRHLGWEDSTVNEFTKDIDVNGIIWESFNAGNQADEINETWPEASYYPETNI